MKAAGIDKFGSTVRSMALPDPRQLAPDEVLIEIVAAGVGNWDEFVRLGEWNIGRSPPMALGVEAAGVVTAVGRRTRRWAPGDNVMTHAVPVRDQGAWSEQLIADGDLLAPKPEHVSWEEAAAFSVPALTAAQALREVVAPSTNGPLLINGAGGVTGGLIAALARLQGIPVIATAGPTSAKPLERLGLEAVYDYHDPDWPRKVLDVTQSDGVAGAINAAPGGESDALSTVGDGGRFATITGRPPAPERGVSIADIYVRADGEQLRELARSLAPGQLEVPVAAVHPLGHAGAALALVSHGGAGGAVVLHP
jgi:NADPH:quinone reductase-like Zn-dependent oxidoreductase